MHLLNSICCSVYLLLLVRHALQLFSKNLFFQKNNTCDFKSNLHCKLIWFWNHAYSCIISDQITLYSANIPLYIVLLLMGETEHLMNDILSHRSGNQLLHNISLDCITIAVNDLPSLRYYMERWTASPLNY